MKNKSPISILCADTHIRSSTPVNRKDDFVKALFDKFNFMLSFGHDKKIPIIVAGDFGHKAIWGDPLLSKVIGEILKKDVDIYIVPGQHDLPNHSIKKLDDSALGVLHKGGNINVVLEPEVVNEKFVLYPFYYGDEIKSPIYFMNYIPELLGIAVAHQLVVLNNDSWNEDKAYTAKTLLTKFPEYDLILTGDNHKSFTYKEKNRLLVNPGSMMRTNINQIDHKPCFFLWYDDNTIERIYFPIEDDVFSDEKIKEEENNNKILGNFVNKINDNYEIDFVFEDNVENYFKTNRTSKNIKSIVWEIIEEIKSSCIS